MIKVVTNSLGSGDWVIVQGKAGEVLFEGHRITPQDLVEILSHTVEAHVDLVEVSDEQMEEASFYDRG